MATKRIRFVLDADYEQAKQFKFLRITLKRKYTPIDYQGPVLYSVHVKGYEFSGSIKEGIPDGEYVVQAYLRHHPRGKGWGASRTRSELVLAVRV